MVIISCSTCLLVVVLEGGLYVPHSSINWDGELAPEVWRVEQHMRRRETDTK
jgi:hypothetical protein